jgi:hypothetical protein
MNGHEHWHGTNCCAMAIAMVMAVCSLKRAAGMHGCEAQQHVKLFALPLPTTHMLVV